MDDKIKSDIVLELSNYRGKEYTRIKEKIKHEHVELGDWNIDVYVEKIIENRIDKIVNELMYVYFNEKQEYEKLIIDINKTFLKDKAFWARRIVNKRDDILLKLPHNKNQLKNAEQQIEYYKNEKNILTTNIEYLESLK
jgi:hypothetical protein